MSSATAKSSEPTIDDILASIRRIIADEQQAEVQQPPVAPRVVVAEASEEVLDLGQPFLRPAAVTTPLAAQPAPLSQPLPAAQPMATPVGDAVVSAIRAKPVEAEPIMAPKPSPVSTSRAARSDGQRLEKLIAGEAEEALSAAFGRISALKVSAETRTLEGLVADLLRPMLKDWLDANLPAIAERLVKQEIERIAAQTDR